MNAKASRPASKSPKSRSVSFYKAETYTPGESVGYLMRRIVTGLSAHIERELEPSGLTNAQWVPLFMLSMGQAETGAELSRECELDAGAMTRLVDRLEDKGLCRRQRSQQDRRVVNLELTTEGRQAVKVVPKVLSELQNQMLQGFSAEEWQLLKVFLRRILDNTRAMQADRESTHE